MLRNIAPKSFWSAFRSGEQSQTAAPLQGSHALASIAAGIVGVILSVSAWNAVWVREDRVAELELSEHADNYALLLQYGISEDLKMLAGLRALFQSSDREITRKEYDAFTDLVLRDKPAVQSLSWTPRVARMERDTLELAASRGDIPGNHIKAITPSGLVRSADRDEYFPILYSTTESVASPIYGLDINSEPMRRSTLERARDSDQPATSAVFRLPAEVGDERAFLVMLPVYRTNMPHDSVESRRRNLRGLVVGVFRVRLMAETILARATTETGLDLYLFAAGAEGQAPPIYFRAAHGQASPTGGQGLASVIAGRHWSGEVRVGDALWRLVAVPVAGGPGMPNHYGAWLALLGGLIASAMVVAYIWASGRQSVVALKVANSQLLTQNQRFDAALHNMLQGLLMLDSDQRVVVCNDRYIEMYGLSREVVKPGLPVDDLLRHRAERGHLNRDLEQYRGEMLSGLAPGQIAAAIIGTRDGREISVASRAMPDGGWVVTHEDISERRRAEAKITHVALHDALTDLPNRTLFRKEIEKRLAYLGRGDKFAVLCLDLDDFKTVNDTLGHPVGDKVLRYAGERLRRCLRSADSVARLGGDEFGVILGGLAEDDDTAVLIARIMSVVNEPFDVDGHQIVAGASVGITMAPADADDPDRLLKNADLALHRSKTEGRGSYRFFEPEMDARMQARHALEIDLRKAIANSEFELYYQPLVKLETEQVCGFEALIRWNHPTRGRVSPLDFIPV